MNVTSCTVFDSNSFHNNIEIFSSNWDGSLVSFSKKIVTFALTGIKYGRRRKTIVLYFEKSLNKHGSRSFMLIKYFYLFHCWVCEAKTGASGGARASKLVAQINKSVSR